MIADRASPHLDLIVPVLEEARCLPGLLDHLARRTGWRRCIVVDGGSADDSADLARRHPLSPLVLVCPGGRHRQLACGLHHSDADGILLVAADVRLSAGAIDAVRRRLASGALHGCLRQRSSRETWLYRWQDAFSLLRARHTGGAYMDQAPFFHRRSLLAIGGFRACGAYDTADAGHRLHQPLSLAGGTVVSSCRAWQAGFIGPTLANQGKRLRHLGVLPARAQ